MLPRSERGVTLLELLLAMTLLAIVLVGLAASYPLAMVGVTIGGFRTAAGLLAQQCLDVAKDMSVNGTLTEANLQAAQACSATSESFGERFTRTVTLVDGNTISGGEGEAMSAAVKVVTVVVGFPAQTEIQPLRVRTVLLPGS